MTFLAASSGNIEQLKELLQSEEGASVLCNSADASGLTALHCAASGGHEECVDALLDAGASVLSRDAAGQTPLHHAAQFAFPMCSYQLASRLPGACLERDDKQQTPIDLAAASKKGEVLNAMLLACSGHASAKALQSMRILLEAGAVCDTWAPNGCSALMLAASADCTEGVQVLLDKAASPELQDALGRTALMFAAGNNVRQALEALLDCGACVAIRDRRGRTVLDYAAAESEVRRVLEERIAEMESRAARLQEELLAELEGGDEGSQKERASRKSKKKKAKQQAKAKQTTAGRAAAEGNYSATESSSTAVQEPQPAPLDQSQQLQLMQQQADAQRQPAHSAAVDVPPLAVGLTAGELSSGEGSDKDQQQAAWQVVGRSQRHLATHRRCPSASSLGSSCSGESHDSSQRSVLIGPICSHARPRAASSSVAAKLYPAAKALGPQPSIVLVAGPALAKPAWGKPAAVPQGTAATAPAPQQQAQPAVHNLNDDATYPRLPALQLPDGKAQHTSFGSSEECREEQQTCQSGAAGGQHAKGSSLLAAEVGTAGLPPAEVQEDAAALAAEVAVLCSKVAHLQLQHRHQEELHQAELAAVLEDTAAHEAAAVAQAVSAERLNCICRFAAFLQNSNNLAVDLLASGNLATAAGSLSGAGKGSLPVPALPSGSLDFVSFPRLSQRQFATTAKGPSAVAPASAAAGALLSSAADTSLPFAAGSAPFCFADLEQRLRTEFSGNSSRFLVPASETQAQAAAPVGSFRDPSQQHNTDA